MSNNNGYYLFFTNRDLNHLNDHVILVVPKSIAEEYRPFFSQFISEDRVLDNYDDITIKQAKQLTDKYKAIDWYFKEELFDPNILPHSTNEEEEENAPFAVDVNAVHVWFGIVDYWLTKEMVQLKKPEEELNVTGTLIKMIHMVFE